MLVKSVNRMNGTLMHLDSHNSQVELFAKFIYDTTKNGDILTSKRAAQFISQLRNGATVTELEVGRWISGARRYTESNLRHFIVRVRGEGWRIAFGKERSRFAGKIVHIHSEWGNRAFAALEALENYEIDDLYKGYILKYKKDLKNTSSLRSNFHAVWMTNIRKERDRRIAQHEKHEQKRIKQK